MRIRRRRLVGFVLTAALVFLAPAAALAGDDATDTAGHTADVLPPPSVVSSELPLLGSTISVTVTLDETGTITTVSVDPSLGDPTEEAGHRVVFVTDGGETSVQVKAYGSWVSTKIRTTDIDKVTGPGVWEADVCGTGLVSVQYTVSVDGAPTITIDKVTTPADVVATVGDPKAWASERWAFASASVKLTGTECSRRLWISVSSYEKDGETKVSLSVSLSGRHHWFGWWGWFGHHGDHEGMFDKSDWDWCDDGCDFGRSGLFGEDFDWEAARERWSEAFGDGDGGFSGKDFDWEGWRDRWSEGFGDGEGGWFNHDK